jgi:hypothetical protein
MSDVRALFQRVHGSIGMDETAMMTASGYDDSSDGVFVIDDITPRSRKPCCLLGEVNASLRATLHDR